MSTPVWAALDAAALPSVAFIARRAQRGLDESKAPLLGVMGAFVFAAQMINFPVGVGTTAHLVGGTLLAITLGPAPASMVMCAILATQALIFQDGGLLALGANIFNMAVAGVLAGYLPFHYWGGGRWRKAAIVGGGALSLMSSALLALAELLISGIKMPAGVLAVSIALFAVSAILEGAITLAVVQALETIQPSFVRKPATRSFAFGALAIASVFLASVGVLFASTSPDGIQRLALNTGIASQARRLFTSPLHDYQAAVFGLPWAGKAGAGLCGLMLIYVACLVFGRVAGRRRSA